MLEKLARKLRKGADKISKVNHGKWRMLSTGEKVLKVVLWGIKLAILVFIGAWILAVILGCWIAVGLMNGITEAVDGQIQRSYDFRHRDRHY